jgi:hypothetical protein
MLKKNLKKKKKKKNCFLVDFFKRNEKNKGRVRVVCQIN